MRGLPFFKAKNKPQFAGLNFSDFSSSGGGGSGDTSALVNKTDLTTIILTGTTNTSENVISAGTWFYLNGKPCIAKVDIASGATFTEGTNYKEKTIGSALTELNSNIFKIIDGATITSANDFPIFSSVLVRSINTDVPNIDASVYTCNTFGFSNTSKSQFIITHTGLYVRSQDSGTWSAWKQISLT